MKSHRPLIVTLAVAALLTAACVTLFGRLDLSHAPGVFVLMLAPGVIAGRYLGGMREIRSGR